MKVHIRYFASVREAMGCEGEWLESPARTLGELRDVLLQRPQAAGVLARGRAVRMALDQTMSDESAPLREGCEVAFFPPVTGG